MREREGGGMVGRGGEGNGGIGEKKMGGKNGIVRLGEGGDGEGGRVETLIHLTGGMGRGGEGGEGTGRESGIGRERGENQTTLFPLLPLPLKMSGR